MNYICFECAMIKGGRPVDGVVTVNPGVCYHCKKEKMVSNPLKYRMNLLSQETKTRLKQKLCL